MPQASSLKELEKSLYEPDKPKLPPVDPNKKVVIGPTEPTVPPLGPPSPPAGGYDDGISRFGRRRFLLWLGIVIALALIVSVFVFWRGFFAFSKGRVDVSIEAPEKIGGATEVTWRVSLNNNNKAGLDAGELIFNFPKNSFNAESGRLVARETKNIGSLGPGQEVSIDFSALVIGGDNFERTARALFRFQPSGSRLILQQDAVHTLVIDSFPVEIEVISPQETLSGQNIRVSFEVNNESIISFNNLRLRLEYPSGFKFLSSQEPLSDFNTLWAFKEILPGEGRVNYIEGIVSGSEGEGKIFRAFLEYKEIDGWRKYKEASFRSDLAVSPLSLSLRLAEGRNNSISLGNRLTYEISWRNNFDVPLSGLTLKAVLDGSLYDFTTLNTNGSFNAGNNTISWSGGQVPQLEVLRPGESGVVTFRVDVKSSFGGAVNPILILATTLDSVTKPVGLTVDRLSVNSEIETKVNGDLNLLSSVFYNEPSGLLSNSGPYPLRVAQETTFTVHWTLKSFANAFEDVRIKAILPSGISWADETRLRGGLGQISYNSSSREVVWSIDEIGANKGLSSPVEAIFKIKVRPSPAQEGSTIPVLSESELIAQDGFTDNRFEVVEKFLNSSLPKDIAGSSSAGRVRE